MISIDPSAAAADRQNRRRHDQRAVDRAELRRQTQSLYSTVAMQPNANYDFQTGRIIAERCNYDLSAVDELPMAAIESFAGVGNPFQLRPLEVGEYVVDLGSGAGFDCFLAGRAVGPSGRVVGVDMTPTMLVKSRALGDALQASNVSFRQGYLEQLPVEDAWADVVMSNGSINLCPDKTEVLAEAFRILKPGGVIQFADIASSRSPIAEPLEHMDLWTARVTGGLPVARWISLLGWAGFVDVQVGDPVDVLGGCGDGDCSNHLDVCSYTFLARRP